MNLSRRWAAALMVALFILTFVTRAYRPVSRPDHWLKRGQEFFQALDDRNWEATRLSRHPGITTAFVSGLALRLYEGAVGSPAESLFTWAMPSYATEPGRQMIAAAMGLALVIAGLVVAITLALRRLSNWTVALLAGGLIVFDPFFLTQSRVVHVDALLSAFMLLSALLLLVSLETGQRRYLLLSGVVGGLAQLTKLPSLFLIPFTGLALLVYLLSNLRQGWQDEHPQGRPIWIVKEGLQKLAFPLLLWVAMSLLPYALWPAMWNAPFKIFGNIPGATGHYVSSPHIHRFFLGENYYREDPGMLFYLVTLPFMMTFLTMTASLIAVGHYTLWRKRVNLPMSSSTFGLLLAYVFFFTLQMSLGAKKADRYLTPAHLALLPIAAVGLAGVITMAQTLVEERSQQFAKSVPALLTSAFVGLQALVALPFAPDYGAHHNYLLGGNPIAARYVDFMSQNEGVAPVVAYLNELGDPDSLDVGIAYPFETTVPQYFSGQVRRGMSGQNDFHMFNYVSMQRDISVREWQAAFEAYAGAPAQLLVVYDRVIFTWLYATQPGDSFEPIIIKRGGAGFVWLAWVWTALFAGILAYYLIQQGEVREPSATQARKKEVADASNFP